MSVGGTTSGQVTPKPAMRMRQASEDDLSTVYITACGHPPQAPPRSLLPPDFCPSPPPFGHSPPPFGPSPPPFGPSIPIPVKVINTILRLMQFACAGIVLVLYALDLNHWRKHQLHADPRWVFVEVIGGVSALTALVFVSPKVKSYMAFLFDFLLFFFWTTLFGLFANLFVAVHPRHGDHQLKRMKPAIWIILVNMLLWLFTSAMGMALALVLHCQPRPRRGHGSV